MSLGLAHYTNPQNGDATPLILETLAQESGIYQMAKKIIDKLFHIFKRI